ncbi:hypothetical protein FEE95_12300 [Maribacter algarum]|uniref:Uncharacterized protein n=1 Tax=Maribacter algarum (ex Zhang et al. 2020) TaxID=2578118 RepID=A0A5S3PRG9_9FLAO|nr:hypothetical protein [Maribacter algarum]TMM57261.1 hypothetical protein FEE95_12300 [Maribacter algarum]
MPDFKKLKRKWLIKGTLGALLFGFGLCCMIESGFLKHGGSIWYEWVLAGTISLCVTISGAVFLIQAGILGRELKKRS